MPKQKPGKSEQAVGTPPEFLYAVQERFGSIWWDLAATKKNSVSGSRFLGPGSSADENALAADWAVLPQAPGDVMWLNPPYGNIRPFVAKAAEQAPALRATLVVLVPASVGTEWFARHVHRKALVLALRPRLTFVGSTDPYPKDLMLVVFGRWVVPGFDVWRWDGGKECPF